jgi:hypothetical protein
MHSKISVSPLEYKLQILCFRKAMLKDYYKSFPSTKNYLEILEILSEIRCLEREKNRYREYIV